MFQPRFHVHVIRSITVACQLDPNLKYGNFCRNSPPLRTFIPGSLSTSFAVCRDKIFAGKVVNMAVLREVS